MLRQIEDLEGVQMDGGGSQPEAGKEDGGGVRWNVEDCTERGYPPANGSVCGEPGQSC